MVQGEGASWVRYACSAPAQVIEPYIRELAPDLIIVSAGFDAAKGDLLGGMRLSPACYGALLPQAMPC